MTTLIATGELNCIYNAGSTPTITLSGTAAEHCAIFADAGLGPSGYIDVCVVDSSMVLAVYRDAVYGPGVIELPSPLKTVGTLVDQATVAVYGIALVAYPQEDRRMLEQITAAFYS